MANLPRGDLSLADKESRLYGRAPGERVKPTADEVAESIGKGSGRVRRGVIALLIAAGAIVGLNEASKRMDPLPTADDVAKWADDNLHGQFFNK
ncbi:MAG: hypothetical protein NTX63_01640 [Candidatus Peregrinibacteria bacterium]|nr:hypothetical protein [Candidatus Peregrinibacteria bacterium]